MGRRTGVLDLYEGNKVGDTNCTYEGNRVGDTNCTAEARNRIDTSTPPSTEKTRDI